MVIAAIGSAIGATAQTVFTQMVSDLASAHRPVGAVVVNRSSQDFVISSFDETHGTWRNHAANAILSQDSITESFRTEAEEQLGKDTLTEEELIDYYRSHYQVKGIKELGQTAITEFSLSGHVRGAQGVILLRAATLGGGSRRMYWNHYIALMIQRKFKSYKAGVLIMDQDQLDHFGGVDVDHKASYILRMMKNSKDADNWKKGAYAVHGNQVLRERAVMKQGAYSDGATATATGFGLSVKFAAAEAIEFTISDAES